MIASSPSRSTRRRREALRRASSPRPRHRVALLAALATGAAALAIAPPTRLPGLPAIAQAPAADGAASADATESSEAKRPRETIFSLIVKGGWIMVPISICSLVIVTAAIERFISLRRFRVETPGLLQSLLEALPDRNAGKARVDAALEICDRSDAIVDRVLRIGVKKLERDEAHAQAFLEETAAKEVHLLRRKLRPFSVVAAVAPLLGLLGTIYGMITCFENAVSSDAAARTETLASGIYVALVSTAAGMTIAIPAMLLHFYFQGRVDRVTDRLDEDMTAFLDHYYGPPAQPKESSGSSRAARREAASAKKAEART